MLELVISLGALALVIGFVPPLKRGTSTTDQEPTQEGCLLLGTQAYNRCDTCPLSKKNDEEGKKKYKWWGNTEPCKQEAIK